MELSLKGTVVLPECEHLKLAYHPINGYFRMVVSPMCKDMAVWFLLPGITDVLFGPLV